MEVVIEVSTCTSVLQLEGKEFGRDAQGILLYGSQKYTNK